MDEAIFMMGMRRREIPVGDDFALTVYHGAHDSGADLLASKWVQQQANPAIQEEPRPADWAAHGRAAGPMRNESMVAEAAAAGLELCLAFWDGHSPGTRDCLTRVAKRGIPVYVVSYRRLTT